MRARAYRCCELPISTADKELRRIPLRLHQGVQYRKVRSLVQNVVVVWRKDKREPWYLMTDLDRSADELCRLYGKRMQIEELFRDYKNRRNGFSLRDTRIRSPENLSRALLILALGYILLLGIGLHAKEHYAPSSWGSSPGRTIIATSSSGSGCWIGSNSK